VSKHLRGVVGVGVVTQLPPADAQYEAIISLDQPVERGFVSAQSVAIEQFQVVHGLTAAWK
jgi:hypothetical protein